MQHSSPDQAHTTIALSVLLDRMAQQLERTAASISRVEASLCVLIGQAASLSPTLIRDLQEIDLAQQSMFDISRVASIAAGASGPMRVDAVLVERAVLVRALSDQFLGPHQPVPTDIPETNGSISWF